MSTQMKSHAVTITAVPDSDDFEWEVECPDGASNCTLWEECGACATYEPTADEDAAGEYERHAHDHQRIDGMWMTSTGDCALGSTDSGADGINDIALEHGAGTYQVHIDYWGDDSWDVDLAKPEPQNA